MLLLSISSIFTYMKRKMAGWSCVLKAQRHPDFLGSGIRARLPQGSFRLPGPIWGKEHHHDQHKRNGVLQNY